MNLFHQSVFLKTALSVALGTLTGCSTTREVESTAHESEFATTTAGANVDAPGYIHAFNKSRFRVGSNPVNRVEFGLQKVIGSDGVFGTVPETGMVMAIPNADAPVQFVAPLTQSADVHNAKVLNYFLAGGLPGDQVGHVDAHAIMSGSGIGDPSGPPPSPALVGYTSVVTRLVAGIPVSDSYAWARFDADGDVVQEGVYWPTIPGSVVEQAKALSFSLADANQRSAFKAKLPPELADGHVVIRHSTGAARVPFEAAASYDATVPGEMEVIRHFDANGREFSLGSEKIALPPEAANLHNKRRAP